MRAAGPQAGYVRFLVRVGGLLARKLDQFSFRILSEDQDARFQSRLFVYVGVITVAANIAIIANPGFFSHDEWEIDDYVRSHGLIASLKAYARVFSGAEFGTPVRPIGFIQEVLLSGWMDHAPFVPHTFSVALQAVTAMIFAKLLFVAGMGRRRSVVAAVLLGVSPLTTFATGWTAACFDQWYPFFALLAGGAVIDIHKRGFNAVRVGCLVAAGACAILSKETAIILPAAAAMVWVMLDVNRGTMVRWWRAAMVGTLAGLPLLWYIAVRLPALLGSAHSRNGPYSPSLTLIPRNLVAYVAYPFLTDTGELVGFLSLPDVTIFAALAVHTLLLMAIVWRFGWTKGGFYLIGYFCFLLPIITLPGLQSHYLFASTFAMSIALACFLVDANGGVRASASSILALAMVMALTQHGFNIQAKLYIDGQCQHDFLTTLDARLADPAGSAGIVIRPTPAARWWVGGRAVHDRAAYAKVHVVDSAAPGPSNYIMDDACRVVSAR